MPKLRDLGFDKEELGKKAKMMMENLRWFDKNKEALKKIYINKYVAIYNEEVVESDDELEGLRGKLEFSEFELDNILIEFINPKDLLLIF